MSMDAIQRLFAWAEDNHYLQTTGLMIKNATQQYDKLEDELTQARDRIKELEGLVREMGKSIDRFMAYGNIYRVRDWETSPYKQAEEILNRPEVREIIEKTP